MFWLIDLSKHPLWLQYRHLKLNFFYFCKDGYKRNRNAQGWRMQFWFRLYIGSRVSAVIIGLFSFWKILNMIDRDTLVVAIFGNYCSFWNDFLGMWGWGDPSYIDFQFYHSIFMCWFTFRFNFIFLDIWIIMSLSHFDWTDWNDCSIFCSQWNLSCPPEKERKKWHQRSYDHIVLTGKWNCTSSLLLVCMALLLSCWLLFFSKSFKQHGNKTYSC